MAQGTEEEENLSGLTAVDLVVDASSHPVQLGIPRTQDWLELICESAQAMEGIFLASQRLFSGKPRNLGMVKRIFYCEGPGSTLGLRLAAAFVRTIIWNGNGSVELFKYNALDLASLIACSPPSSIQAPFRRGRRFVRLAPKDCRWIGEKKIMDEEEALEKFPSSVHLPDTRPSPLQLPPRSLLPYDLAKINGLEDLEKVSVATDQPIPYTPEPMVFKKWVPSIKKG